MKVNVKWSKEVFSDIEVDTTQPPLVFKSQLFTLSGVPPERQKVLIKGGQLKDDEWGKQQPKEGMTIMMMGSADEIKVEAPTNAPKFVEDLPGVLLLLLLLLRLLLFQFEVIRAFVTGCR
jgi:ubiquitin carboxyl-terminal hydrolase 14